MAFGVMAGMASYEYYSSSDSPFFKNPKNSPVVNKLNTVISNMVVDNNSNDRDTDLTIVAPNNYRLDISAIDKNIPQEKYEANKSCYGLRTYTIIDKNSPTQNKRSIDKRGFVNPVNDWQTSYVAVPLVYTGKELSRKLDPFAYDSQLSANNYSPLYPPQWDIVRRNYPEYRAIVDSVITDRFASYIHNKMYYSDINSCWIKCDTARVRELVESITDRFYESYILKPLKEEKESTY